MQYLTLVPLSLSLKPYAYRVLIIAVGTGSAYCQAPDYLLLSAGPCMIAIRCGGCTCTATNGWLLYLSCISLLSRAGILMTLTSEALTSFSY